jgi:nitroreductase
MEFSEVIGRRYSVRAYENREIDEETLQGIIEAARVAPSASNRQEWRFIAVRDAETRRKLAKIAHNQDFVAQASVVLAACAVTDYHKMSCGQYCYPIDVAIALEHVALAATNAGLGTCWIGAFDETQAKALLGVPENVRIIDLMTLGWPADKPRPKSRLPLEDILMLEKWRE